MLSGLDLKVLPSFIVICYAVLLISLGNLFFFVIRKMEEEWIYGKRGSWGREGLDEFREGKLVGM